MSRSRDTSNIFDPDSPVVIHSELMAGMASASAAAVSYTDSELGSIDLSSTIQTASAAAVSYLIDGAPGALDTLNELASALNDDQNFATSILTTISSASAATLSAANIYTDNATPDLTPAIQAASAAAVAYTDQEIATIDLTSTIVTASTAAASYADNLISSLPPLISGISPDNIVGTASTAVVVNGQNFQSGSIIKLIDNSDEELFTLSTTFNNSRSLQFLTPALTASAGPYDIKVTNPDNQISILENALTVGQSPVWQTTSGLLGNIYDSGRSATTFQLSATDPDSQSITYSIVSGSLPTNMSMSSSGLISGTAQAVGADTSYAFTVRATDTVGNYSDRSFSITTKGPIVQSFTSAGTTYWISPTSGSVQVLVVAGGGGGGNGFTTTACGGGGGAGGYVYQSVSVTKDQSYTIVVGNGGAGGQAGSAYAGSPGYGKNGENSQFGSLTAIGGGGGTNYPDSQGRSGGSGGGGGGAGGSTQIGGAGTSGQGNSGGSHVGTGQSNNSTSAGGGGGAGSNGFNGTANSRGGNGGIGILNNITGANVYYAGGGGGGAAQVGGGYGGLGGGGNGGEVNSNGQNGTANTGGGGGGASCHTALGTSGGAGGSGVVIIRY